MPSEYNTPRPTDLPSLQQRNLAGAELEKRRGTLAVPGYETSVASITDGLRQAGMTATSNDSFPRSANVPGWDFGPDDINNDVDIEEFRKDLIEAGLMEAMEEGRPKRGKPSRYTTDEEKRQAKLESQKKYQKNRPEHIKREQNSRRNEKRAEKIRSDPELREEEN